MVMLVLSLCLKNSTDGEFLVSSGRECAWLKGEMSYSIVGILRGLSEGSSRHAKYIDLRQTVGGTSEGRFSGDKEFLSYKRG